MSETGRNSVEQDAPTTTEGEEAERGTSPTASTPAEADPAITGSEAAGGDDPTADPLAAGKGRIDEVDQSKGIFPEDAPHPASDTVLAPGALGGGPYDESGRGGVAVSLDQSTSGAGQAGAEVARAGAAAAAGADPMNARALSTLQSLIHLDADAIQAYKHAIDACESVEIRERLTEFMGDHERHVRDLRAAVRSLGGEPVEGRDLKGFFIEGFTAIASQGDRSALFAMRGNEELTNRRYDGARSAGLPGSVQPIIERNYEDEVRHLAWIKEAISSHAWDTDAGGKRAA